MRVLLASLLISTAVAIDSVLFSNEQKITNEYPSVENILSTATAESPVVFFVNPDFILGQFSQRSFAFSDEKVELVGLAGAVKTAKYNTARFLDSGVHAPSAVEVTSADDFKTGSAVYIVSADSWVALDALAQKILPSLGSKFTGIITETEAVSKDHTRVKRVTMNQAARLRAATSEGDVTQNTATFPLTIPPYFNFTGGPTIDRPNLGSCFFYSEGFNIVVYSKNNKPPTYATAEIRGYNTTNQWSYEKGDVHCDNSVVGNYSFTIRVITSQDINGYGSDTKTPVFILPAQTIVFTLYIQGDNLGYWKLVNAVATSVKINNIQGETFLSSEIHLPPKGQDKVSAVSVDYVGMNSVQGWAWGCYSSQALFFNPDEPSPPADPPKPAVYDHLIGISFYNTEIQTYGAVSNSSTGMEGAPISVKFTLNMDDCTGTFSTGSWMGIISAVVLLFGLFFGYIMLQAVKTMDRFDDPKQKQILINVRE